MFSTFISVIKPISSTNCATYRPLEVSASEGYISSVVADNGWGSVNCPWKIIAQPGQTINIIAIDFHPLTSHQNCQKLGIVIDTQSKKETDICRNSHREQHVYLSSGHHMEIQIENTDIKVLLHFKGI